MHAVVRNYSGKGAKELLDVLEKNKSEVERLSAAVGRMLHSRLASNTRYNRLKLSPCAAT